MVSGLLNPRDCPAAGRPAGSGAVAAMVCSSAGMPPRVGEGISDMWVGRDCTSPAPALPTPVGLTGPEGIGPLLRGGVVGRKTKVGDIDGDGASPSSDCIWSEFQPAKPSKGLVGTGASGSALSGSI